MQKWDHPRMNGQKDFVGLKKILHYINSVDPLFTRIFKYRISLYNGLEFTQFQTVKSYTLIVAKSMVI